MSGLIHSLKHYIRFTGDDSSRLRAFLPLARPYFQGFAANFYDRITLHPDAHRVLEGPAQVARLKMTLMKWMRSGLKGPHDQTFYNIRSRIGRVHVAIGLPHQFMFAAMNVMRLDYHNALAEVYLDDPVTERQTRDAIDKLFDLELALMLHTYQEDSEERLRRNVRLATIGRLAANLSSELRHPLGVIGRSATQLQEHVYGDDAEVLLRRIAEQVGACEEIIAELVGLHQEQPLLRRRVNVLRIVADAQAAIEFPHSVQVELSCDAGLSVRADPDLLRQAVRELFALVLSAHPSDTSPLHVSAHREEHGIVIDVSRPCAGSRELLDGLGLQSSSGMRSPRFRLDRAIVEGVASGHGGSVQLIDTPQGNPVVRLSLPDG